jgi:LPS-assembly lipoprotein
MILRASLRAVLLLALAGSLTACFQPVHGIRLGNSTVSGELSKVAVAPVGTGYLGYSLKSELDFLLGNGAIAQNPSYVLTVRAVQSRSSNVIDSATSRPQSVAIQAEATYELKEVQTGRIRASGKTFGSASYDRSNQRFGTIRAQRDAEERLGKALAERLRILVSASLLQNPGRDVGPAPALNPPIDPWQQPEPQDPGDQT